MTLERQPEIEVYVRDCSMEQLAAWLVSVVGSLEEPKEAGDAVVYASAVGPIVVRPGIKGGPFVGVWFNTPNSPWASDVECARHAARELGCTIRCCPGKAFPEVPRWVSDIFLEVSGEAEQLVKWA